MTDNHSREHFVHNSGLTAIWRLSNKLARALGRVRGGIFAHTGLLGDRFGVWGNARAGHNALVHSI